MMENSDLYSGTLDAAIRYMAVSLLVNWFFVGPIVIVAFALFCFFNGGMQLFWRIFWIKEPIRPVWFKYYMLFAILHLFVAIFIISAKDIIEGW